MPGEITLSASTLIAFLLVLSRVSGAFIFLPMPTRDAGPSMSRVILSIGCAIALFPSWPQTGVNDLHIGTLIMWMIAELAFGAAIGLAVMFIAEALAFGAQVIGVQAGYAYASVVDPMTQAESDVLPVLSQLAAGLLFFTTGLHRLLIRAFSDSLRKYPPGAFHMSTELSKAIAALASGVFSVGIRLALPVIALLFMTDVALALVGRINSQLHLGMHAFPAKMLVGMILLALVLAVWPALYQDYASGVIDTIRRTLAG